jgi:hypothetical protein
VDVRTSAAVVSVRDAGLALVQDERGVRVEDYLTALASAAGEAVIVDAGLFDIEHSDMAPGAAVFGDALNVLLSGDATEIEDVDATTVVGTLRDELVPGVVPLDALPPLAELYELVARSAGNVPWGAVAVSVGDDHEPWVMPLRMAFELRPTVDAAMAAVDADPAPDRPARHVVCALALASALEQTAQAIDPAVAVRLSMEVLFGMAKTVPMSQAALDEAATDATGDAAGDRPDDA